MTVLLIYNALVETIVRNTASLYGFGATVKLEGLKVSSAAECW